MESHPYSYGTKLTGLILHLFFTVVLTIAVFLLASMLSKNIFELSDVGTEQFLDSGYYTKCIEKKCDDLSDYLRLLIKGESRTSEENRRYLQYTNEFKSGLQSIDQIQSSLCLIKLSFIKGQLVQISG